MISPSIPQQKINASSTYLGMEVQPDSVQGTGSGVALQVGNSAELLDESLGVLLALVSVARHDTVALQSLVDVVLVVEVNGHTVEVGNFLVLGVLGVALGLESGKACTVLVPFCN